MLTHSLTHSLAHSLTHSLSQELLVAGASKLHQSGVLGGVVLTPSSASRLPTASHLATASWLLRREGVPDHVPDVLKR